MQHLVSIIIPVYNRANLIGETLESILKQSYSNWECILVDDCSTDNTREICIDYCNENSRISFYERPQLMLKEANSCRNYGFEKSKGSYVQWFDSDDVMHYDKLKTKIQTAQRFNADVIVSTHTTTRLELIKEFKTEHFISEAFYIDYILGKKTCYYK